MRSTGGVSLPLHGGHCPPWLFARMTELGASIIEAIVIEFGAMEVLRRMADPVWFQALGSVLGFDWHSSGLTTTLCGALKEGLRKREGELGLFFAGGKGRASRQTPVEIETAVERYSLEADPHVLQRASRLVAKVDNTALQDGYQLYHHFFIFTSSGQWAVVQQGMNEGTRYARRYHWLGEEVKDFVDEPHKGISGIRDEGYILDLTASLSSKSRDFIIDLIHRRPEENLREIDYLVEKLPTNGEISYNISGRDMGEAAPCRDGDHRGDGHPISFLFGPEHRIPDTARLDRALRQAYDYKPENFTELLEVPGVGPSTVRALAMVAEIIYGVPASHRDPVRYCFAHGGKDGHPFPVKKGDYDHSIAVLREVVNQAKMGYYDKMRALQRLATWQEELDKNASQNSQNGEERKVIVATPFLLPVEPKWGRSPLAAEKPVKAGKDDRDKRRKKGEGEGGSKGFEQLSLFPEL